MWSCFQRQIALLFLAVISFGLCAFELPLPTYLRLPPMPQPPEVDGKIYSSEWLMSSPTYGSYSSATGMFSLREVHHHIGYDDNFLYLAQQSELPQPPMTLSADDRILVSFGEEELTTIIFNADGYCTIPEVRAAVTQRRGYLEFEAAIPWSAFGLDGIAYGQKYRLQIARDFKNVDEHVIWSWGEAGAFVPEKGIPAVGFKTLGPRWKGTGYEIQWSAANPGLADAQVKVDAQMISNDPPRSLNITLTPQEGKEVTAQIRGIFQPLERLLQSTITNVADGKPLYQRDFCWEANRGVGFVDPDPPYVLDLALYPSRHLIKARLTCGNAKKLSGLKDADFRIVDEQGEVHNVHPFPASKLQDLWEIPELPEGRYNLEAIFTDAQGQPQIVRHDFAIRKFPWQGQNLGGKRTVLPPYIPLTYANGRLSALQTAWQIGTSGLWDGIFAQDENLLAAPVTLTLDGIAAKPVGAPTILQSSDAQFTLESQLDWEGKVAFTLKQEYDFDGFCKATLTVTPKQAVTLNDMRLDIPLKSENIQFVSTLGNGMRMNTHAALPQKDGVVWNSLDDSGKGVPLRGFRPYIWLGELYKGLAFVCESPAKWERAPETAAQEILRQGDTAIFRLNLANHAFRLDAPRQYVFALQPTPTRPQVSHWRNQYGTMYNCQNPPEAICMDYNLNNFVRFLGARFDDGLVQVPNGDWSFVKFLTEAKWKTKEEVEAFARKHLEKIGMTDENYSKWYTGEPDPGDDLVTRMYQGCCFWKALQIRFAYMNPRSCCPDWPEWEMYVDEWFNGPWRPARSFRNETSCNPDNNFCDFLLWNTLRLLPFGWNALYIDNLFDMLCWDPALSPYGDDTPYWPIFSVRELVRRAATVSYEKGLMMNGRPLLMIHMTDCNVIPWLSLASHSLDWEMNFGDRPYPERFPDAYIRCNSLGTQTGTTPFVLINSTGANGAAATDSLLATCFAYGLLAQNDAGLTRTQRFFTLRDAVFAFGYGRADTQVWPAWDTTNPVGQPADGKIRGTYVKRADGEAMLMVGNLDSLDGEGSFQLPEAYTAVNAETGAELPVDERNRLTVPVKGYNCALIYLKK